MTESARWSVGIVVPAHDESALIRDCVASVLDALQAADVDGWAVVVADACTDDTAARAALLLDGRGEVRVSDGRSVGGARRIGAAAVLDHFAATGASTDRIWLMATDADTTVPADWIRAHLRAADSGARAVAGTVAVSSFVEHPRRVADLYRRHYTVHADGRHGHLHGANLGVRADAYVEVGGWHPLTTGEDHDLWDRLRAAGHPVTSTIAAPVLTSGRRTGRAPDGFAAFLGRLGGAAEAPVPS